MSAILGALISFGYQPYDGATVFFNDVIGSDDVIVKGGKCDVTTGSCDVIGARCGVMGYDDVEEYAVVIG